MIEALIEISIRKRLLVLVFTFIFSIIGLYNAMHLSVDAVPDVTNVQVSVVTASPGLSPIEVEQFITYPVELAMNGLPNVEEIRSISRTGVSSVTIIFKDQVDIWFARQIVNERLKMAEAEIPEGYGKPELSPVATALGDIYEFVLTSDRHSPMELRTYMDWELVRKIKSVPGVIDINTIGGEVKQYQVVIDPRRLASHDLTLSIILEKLRSSNANVGGGYIMKGNEQLVIRGEGQFKSIDDLSKTAILTEKDGTPLLLGNVADIKLGPSIRFGLITRDEKEVVGGTVMMLIGQNSREVVKSVKDRIEEIKKNLPPGMKIEPFYDRSEFIDRALKTVFINLAEGAILVFIALIVTLGTAKGGALVAMAIPVSMLIAVIFMRQLGIVGNLMSLGALDFGLLVDGSIVMLEAVLAGFYAKKALFTPNLSESEEKALTQEIIIDNCKKVARAAAFAVAIIMLVYLPLMALEGQEGKMFRPMAITVALALCAALLFSLTTFPAAVSYVFAKPNFHHSHYWDVLEKYFAKFLIWGFANKKAVTLYGIALILFSFALASTLGAEFIPRIDEGEINIDARRLPSASINHSRDLNFQIEKVIESNFPEVTGVVTKVGRGESAAEPIGTDEGEMYVKLKDKKEWVSASDREELMTKMKEKILATVPSTYISMSQPIENRVNALLAGSKADVVIKIYGDDLEKLKKIGEKYSETLSKIEGTGDLRIQRVLGLPLLEIRPNKEKMARYGVQTSEILEIVKTLRVGYGLGKVFEGLRKFDLVVRLDVDVTDSDQMENIPVMTSSGYEVPLGLVADIEKVEGPAAIYRESLKRRLFVEVNIRGRDLVSYINEAQDKTAEIQKGLPQGYEVEWGGQFQNFTRAKDRLALVVPIALTIIFAMLMAAFGSIFYAIGVFLVVPLAVAGGIIALILRGLPFSIPAGVGFIAVAGIAVLNGVVYASTLKHELSLNPNIREGVIKAALLSLRPRITTEAIAAIGFIPMSISTMAGAEVQRPLATVVIGGIIIATTISSLMLPIAMEFLLKIRKREVQENNISEANPKREQ
jgi:cobalt-zinc-cadmium resistance protein CzcA